MKETSAHGSYAPAERSLVTMLSLAASAMCILWVPLVALCHVDGLRMYSTWPQIARDFSLLTLIAVGLVSAGSLLVWIATRALLAWQRSAREIAWWAGISVPLLLCLLQLAYTLHTWLAVLRVDHPSIALIAPRWIAALLLVLALCFGPIRTQGRSLAAHCAQGILDLRWLAASLIVVSAVGALLLAPEEDSKLDAAPAHVPIRPAPNILLVSLDTLAAADAGVCLSGPDNMPRLRAFATQAACFEHFYAASNATSPAMSSIDTGLYPWQHWAVQLGGGLPRPLRLLSLGAGLKALGYTTHYVGPMMQASPSYRQTHGGYDTIDPVAGRTLQQWASDRLVQLNGSNLSAVSYLTLSFLGALDVRLGGSRYPYPPKDVYDTALARFRQIETSRRPWFLWMHSMQPHAPYLPTAEHRYRRLAPGTLETWADLLPDNTAYKPERQGLVDQHRLRYQESMLAADQALGDMLQELSRRRLLDNTIVVVTGDHGESFSHGWLGHGSSALHQDVIRVPLIIRLPGQTQARLMPTPTSQVDLAPSLLELAGAASAPPAMAGRSFAPALHGLPTPARPIYAMAMQRQSRFEPIRAGDYVMISGDAKLSYHLPSGRFELIDLSADPGEQQDIAKADPLRARKMLVTLQEAIAAAERMRQQSVGGQPAH